MGFTCWTEPGWMSSVTEVIPSFTPPSALSSPWKDPETIKENLSSLGFEDITVSNLRFETRESNLDAYLELMKLLLPKLLSGENATKYDNHMKAKHEKKELEMSWRALIVSATRP